MSAMRQEESIDRAGWYLLMLRRHSAGLAPRDREILSVVAASKTGVTLAELADPGRYPGVTGELGVRRALQLVRQGLLVRVGDRVDVAVGAVS